MTTALLVIDAQRSFYEGFHVAPWDPMPPLPGADLRLAAVVALVDRARDAGVPVVFVQHCEEGSELEKGSATWELHPALGVRPGEAVVEKETPDAFAGTALAEVLAGLGAGRVVICGNQTDMCVNATTRAALALGYEVALAADAHGTWGGKDETADQVIARHNADLAAAGAVVAPAAGIPLG